LGWLLPWAETAQEALDLALMAWRVGEDKRVSLPVAIGLDGAFLTHSQQIVKIPTQAAVDKFLPPFDLGDRLLHSDNPITIAPQGGPQGRSRAPQVVPALRDRRDREEPLALQGRGCDRPRLLVRLALLRRRALQRGPLGALFAAEAAGRRGLHRGPRRARDRAA